MIKALLVSMLLAVPVVAHAQTPCDGGTWDGTHQLTISWNTCAVPWMTPSPAPVFRCGATPTTNQTASLHFGFKSPILIPSAVSATGILDVVQAPGNPLPPYYHYESTGCAGSGAVKGVSLSVSPAPQFCTDNFYLAFCDDGGGGNACSQSGFQFTPDLPAAGIGRFVILAVRDFGLQIDPGLNLWAGSLSINNRLRNDCAGCQQPASWIWQSVGIGSDDGMATVCLTGWDTEKGGDDTGHGGNPTSIQNSTWGQIKALYR